MRRLRILSLDGGGLRGIFTLRLLQALERECRQPVQELFDYVIGTSTGGILALALFHCGFTIEECVDLYRELGAEAFQRWKVGAGRAHAYDHYKLEALLRAKFGDRQLAAPSTTHVAVVAHRWDQAPNRVAIFANYDIDPSASRFERAPRSAAVWEAARATSAAPTYFEPCTIHADGAARQYVDGGLVANNPVLLAFAEASTLGIVGSVVSLGTGRLPVDVRTRDPNPWLWRLAKDLVEGSLEASANIQEGASTSIFEYLAIPYLRLDGNVFSSAMEDASRMSSWVAAADEILADPTTRRALADFCRANVRRAVSPKPAARPAAKSPALPGGARSPLAAIQDAAAPTKRTPRRQAVRWDEPSSSEDEAGAA